MSEFVDSLINNLSDDNMIGAKADFTSALNAKLAAALDQERINVANQVFNNFKESDDGVDIDDITDEEISRELESE